MIPRGITKRHFLKAASQIDGEGVPVNRRSVHYDLVLNNKRYPPKYVVSLATKYMTGIEHPAHRFNAVEAKDYFLSRGFEVIDRREEMQNIVVDENDESRFPEGAKKYHLHRKLERDSGLAKRAKAKRLLETEGLECDVCSMNFAKVYGKLGVGFIEAHHTVPVSLLRGKEKTKLGDISLVCSNCHRMLHRGKKLLSVAQLREIVKNTQ